MLVNKTKIKVGMILLIVLIASTFDGCYGQGPCSPPLGAYTVQGIEYLTPVSSSTMEYFLEKNKGAVFDFSKNEFDIQGAGHRSASIASCSFPDVSYEEVSLGKALSLTDVGTKEVDLSRFKSRKAFLVFSDDADTGYTIYLLDKEVWISHIAPAGKNLMTDYLLKLEKRHHESQ